MKKLILVFVVVCLSAISLYATTYTHTIAAKTWSAYGAQTLTGVSWTAAATGGAYWGYDATKGQQFGSAGSPAKPLTLSTSDISGTITSIKISTSGASSVAGTLTVSVGGVAFSPASITLTATNTEYTFTGSGSGQILITWNQTSSKALYLKKIEVDYSASATPTITVAPSTLTSFNYTAGSGPSAEQNFVISGSNLTANISIAPPTNYEISTGTGGSFVATNPITLTQSGGSVANTTIYVRLKAGLSAGNYNSENITATSTDATDKTVACSGSVTAAPTPTLTSSVANLSGFAYMEGSGPSANQTFTISGSNLSGSGNITVTGTTNYEVSTDGTAYSSSVTYPYASGVITSQPKTVYVRLKTGLTAGNYNSENIVISGGSASPINVACSGSVSVFSSDCGSETFTNSNATATYADNSFVGDNGVTWTFVASRDESTYGITGKGLMLRRTANNSKVTSSTVSGGIGDFTCSLRKAFTGAGNRQVELFVNGVSQGTSIAWDNTSVQTFTVSNINIAGDIVVEIRNITAYQVIVDDISWTCYSSGSSPEIQLTDASLTNQACGALSLDFGTLAPSTNSDLTFNIKNTGSADLDISSFSGLTATDFAIVSPATPFTVSASGSQTVTVRYTANASTGTVNETLTINNNDSDEGTCTVNLTGVSSTSIAIPDNGCSTNNDAISTFNYSGGTSIADVNIFVSITHAYRSDLAIEVESPQGTIVQLFDGTSSGGEDNLEVNFDDEGVAISSNAHTVNGSADENVTSDVDLLSSFDGENPNGNWIIRVCDAASSDIGQLETWSLNITESCTPSHSVSSYTPQEGPQKTQVIVTGTGFTGSTSATINGTAASIISQTATQLIIEIPNGATTGNIVITESACNVTAGSFTVLDEDNCSNAPANWTGDLLISSAFDETSGSCHYIELYNPTGSAIDLTNYSLGSDNNAASAGAAPPASYNGGTFNLSGTVPAYSTFLVLGSAGGVCSGCSLSADQSFGALGFNGTGIDRVFLLKSGTAIDLWANGESHNDGYSYTRASTSTAPTLTWNNSDWSSTDSPVCGNFQVEVNNPPTISVLSNYNSCELDLSVTATAGGGGTLTYQWYYTDNISNGWTAVTSANPAGLTIVGENTNNLIIVSDVNSTSSIDGYQFYVKVIEDGACSKVANAARYTISGETYFRSTGTGNWNSLTSWEMATSTSGPWVSACIVPDDSNSDYVSIENSHNISIIEGVGAPDLTINQLIVQTGGTLTIEEQAEVEVTNGNAGADFTVNGTLRDEASSGAGNGISFLTGATWILGANGTIIKTYNSSVTTYRDNYENGINNIPATADWVYEYSGQGAVATVAVDMFYPNLHFESTSGIWNAGSFSEALTGGSGGFLTVKGDLSIGVGSITGGTGNCIIYNNNINSTPMLVLGDVYIENGSVLTNDSYDGVTNTARGDGTGLEVKGGLFIDGRLDHTHGTGKTVLSGTSKQDIVSSNSGEFKAYDFVINNTNNIELDGLNLEIENSLTFTNGKIITDVLSSDMVFVKNPSTTAIVGGNTSGTSKFVQGKLQRSVNTGLSYVFPIGHSTQNAQGFTITPTGANGSNILGYLETNNTNPTVAYAYCDLETHPGGGLVNSGDGDAGYDGILDQIIFDLESPLQWDVTNPGGGITSYNITTHANGGQDIAPVTSANGNDVRFLLKNGEPGNSGVSTGQGLPGFTDVGFLACPNGYTLTGMTSFSKFTINGATKNNTTLPVELTSFSANCNHNEVDLVWATSSELNNDYFEVQRSYDAAKWELITIIDGAGNSNKSLSYSFTDENLNQKAYYRLKQVDFDGKFEYSKIITANCNISNNASILVYPNPVQDIVKITIANWNDDIVFIEIYDMMGKLVYKSEHKTEHGATEHSINLSNFKSGIYVIRFTGNSIIENIRIEKN